jgi:hypothetical protein
MIMSCCCGDAIDVDTVVDTFVVAVVLLRVETAVVGVESDCFMSGQGVIASRLVYCRSKRPRDGDGKGTRMDQHVECDVVVVVVVVGRANAVVVVVSSDAEEQEGD